MLNGFSVSLKQIAVIVALLGVFAGIVASYTVTRTATTSNQQAILKLESNNQYEHDKMCKLWNDKQEKLITAVTEINNNVIALQTEIRLMRRHQ